jgi:hypothetical protein
MTRTMWKELKQLIQSRLADRSRPRRASERRFRGQFERLEAREVLSATIGVMAVDVEAGTITIAVWESRPQESDLPQFAAFERGVELREAGFDGKMLDRVSLANNYGVQDKVFTGFGGGPGFPGGGPFNLAANAIAFWGQHLTRPILPAGSSGPGSGGQGGTSLDLLDLADSSDQTDAFDFESQLGGNKVDRSLPQQSNYGDPDGVGNTNFGQLNVKFNGDTSRRPDPPPRLQTFALSSHALFAVSEVADPSTLSIDNTLEARDSAFDAYSTDSLLLAASVDGDADDEDLGLNEDERDAESDAPADKSALVLVEDAGESLDALEREQAAIDEVLAELHDLNLRQDDQSTDSARADNQAQSHSTREAEENGWQPYDTEFGSDNFSQAEGGMVLLEPTGDANSSAYDLTSVFTGNFARPHEVALGLEATVGLQQAFDVGSNERFESTSARAPVAQPAAAGVQPSVSAENAPAKKSEQPS